MTRSVGLDDAFVWRAQWEFTLTLLINLVNLFTFIIFTSFQEP